MSIFRMLFYRLLIFVLILLVADRLFGLVFRPIFRLQERGKYFTTSYAIRGTADDIIIFGNSHAAQHFNANRMIDSLSVTAFNFGNQYQSILYYYPVLESVLLHHIPKLVVLNLDPDELLYNKNDYERLSILQPYFNENSFIDSSIYSIGKLERYKAVSNLYRFNSTIGYVCLNLFTKSYGKSVLSRGFDPQDGSLCKLNLDEALMNEEIVDRNKLDTIKIRFLNQIIGDLKKKNVNLLVTFAPVYKGRIKKDIASNKLVSILSENHVEYVNYYSDNRFVNDCTLFNDQNHLNLTGANIFTDLIIREIKDKKLLTCMPNANSLSQK